MKRKKTKKPKIAEGVITIVGTSTLLVKNVNYAAMGIHSDPPRPK
jgi:hypothetical protein